METMPHRPLVGTGMAMGVVSLGAWTTLGDQLDDAASADLLDAAHESGITMFDHAETYARGDAEKAFGRIVAKLGWDRETYSVCAKTYWGVHDRAPNTWGLGRKHLRDGCDRSLRSLGTDYLDLMLAHRYDESVPLVETVRAMSDLVDAGKVLYWGTSEWDPEQILAARTIARDEGLRGPVVEQRQYNMVVRDRVEKEFPGVDTEIGLMVWSPLLYGLLTGRYDDGFPADGRLTRPAMYWLRRTALGADEDVTLARVRALNAVAREAGLRPATMALAWTLQNPRVTTAVAGARSRAQLADLVEAASVRLEPELMTRISAVAGSDHPSRGEDADARE